MRPSGSPEELERRRVRAIRLLMQGHQAFEVARLVGVDRRSIRRWNRVYREAGDDGLRRSPLPAVPPSWMAGPRNGSSGSCSRAPRPPGSRRVCGRAPAWPSSSAMASA